MPLLRVVLSGGCGGRSEVGVPVQVGGARLTESGYGVGIFTTNDEYGEYSGHSKLVPMVLVVFSLAHMNPTQFSKRVSSVMASPLLEECSAMQPCTTPYAVKISRSRCCSLRVARAGIRRRVGTSSEVVKMRVRGGNAGMGEWTGVATRGQRGVRMVECGSSVVEFVTFHSLPSQ